MEMHLAVDNGYDFDMIVIGGGAAGQKAAISATKAGRRALLVEKKGVVGGACINTGTIPSKSLREAVLYLSGWRERAVYGISYAVKHDITLIDARPRLLPFVDEELTDALAYHLREQWVTLRLGEMVKHSEIRPDGMVRTVLASRRPVGAGKQANALNTTLLRCLLLTGYLCEIGRTSLLRPEEEVALAQRVAR
jgi:pyruvate/2-oxoglutarate dehydrogenase complex dihydrolipoamide dehydrogenase (E3) component